VRVVDDLHRCLDGAEATLELALVRGTDDVAVTVELDPPTEV
jgi:hypothetical protein